jgi:hypothetical protein
MYVPSMANLHISLCLNVQSSISSYDPKADKASGGFMGSLGAKVIGAFTTGAATPAPSNPGTD